MSAQTTDGRDASRTHRDLKAVATQANQLYDVFRLYGIDHAACLTAGWSRRLLLDVALEMTRRHMQIMDPPHRINRNIKNSPRMQAEDARWTDDDAKDARARYAKGARDPETVEGRRVFQRRYRRQLRLVTIAKGGRP